MVAGGGGGGEGGSLEDYGMRPSAAADARTQWLVAGSQCPLCALLCLLAEARIRSNAK